MPKRKPSPRQQEILDLLKGDPSLKAGEIAKILSTSEGAVYQQISRLRSAKLLPKAKRGGSRPRLSTADSNGKQTAGAATSSVSVSTNGHAPALSLEAHLSQELTDVGARIKEIAEERDRIETETRERVLALGEEEGTLVIRHKQLDKAKVALTPA